MLLYTLVLVGVKALIGKVRPSCTLILENCNEQMLYASMLTNEIYFMTFESDLFRRTQRRREECMKRTLTLFWSVLK